MESDMTPSPTAAIELERRDSGDRQGPQTTACVAAPLPHAAGGTSTSSAVRLRDGRHENGPRGAQGVAEHEKLWTVAEVADYLRMSQSWVYHRAEEGRLPCVRIAGRVRFVPAHVRAALNLE
jgi:excisionase family DNA binding protein